ncbi:MAG: alkaline phosphatase family protein [Pirellulales bacterium]|nr:alkaline phosphatase family protein [Pirellulales bacterium]
MSQHVILLSIPGLREMDVAKMKRLKELTAGGEIANLVPSFPGVTCPVQAAMTTGKSARQHGVVANGFYWREQNRVEMWTSPSDCIGGPQIWDVLHERLPGVTSAVWFPLHSKGCPADYVCTPAPIHNPDGSESLWCYTRPEGLYGTLRDKLGHFPLHHYWGPMAGLPSSRWIVDSAVHAAKTYRPHFFYIYLQHLDYAAQRTGPDSPEALKAVDELDEMIGQLAEGFGEAYGADTRLFWLVAGEYAITSVSHVSYPNRILREAGLLEVEKKDDGEHLDLAGSRAWAMVDHQFSHVFIKNADRTTIQRVVELFTGREGIEEVLSGEGLARYDLDHPRSGELVLVSSSESWQAYYWWLDDAHAPGFARSVDIHRKPGYDPVELHFDPPTKSIPLDATLVAGSHGAPARDPSQQSVLLANEPGHFPHHIVRDTDVFEIVLGRFGL